MSSLPRSRPSISILSSVNKLIPLVLCAAWTVKHSYRERTDTNRTVTCPEYCPRRRRKRCATNAFLFSRTERVPGALSRSPVLFITVTDVPKTETSKDIIGNNFLFEADRSVFFVSHPSGGSMKLHCSSVVDATRC